MPRYIDVDGLPMYDELFMKGKNDSGVWVRYKDVEKLLRNAPTADVVEVVRCKDCHFCNIYDDTDSMLCRVFDIFVRSDFFCQDGKRRKDNEDIRKIRTTERRKDNDG